jgi:hypothetical protein
MGRDLVHEESRPAAGSRGGQGVFGPGCGAGAGRGAASGGTALAPSLG